MAGFQLEMSDAFFYNTKPDDLLAHGYPRLLEEVWGSVGRALAHILGLLED